MARFGMLECGKNFKGTMKEMCATCDAIDNEEHRLNECVSFRSTNYLDSDDKIPFHTIYSDDTENVRAIFSRIWNVWNVTNGRGGMNSQ